MPKMIIGNVRAERSHSGQYALHIGKGAIEAGMIGIVLANNAPFLMKRFRRESVLGVGMPPLKDLFQFAVCFK